LVKFQGNWRKGKVWTNHGKLLEKAAGEGGEGFFKVAKTLAKSFHVLRNTTKHEKGTQGGRLCSIEMSFSYKFCPVSPRPACGERVRVRGN
jgi:hypothetical protein